jgi:hypothetical protein
MGQHALSFECLEERLLLSSVSVSLTGGQLDITGGPDNESEDVVVNIVNGQIVISSTNGDVNVTGGGAGLTDNNGTVTVTGNVDSINVDLGGGSDSVTMSNISLASGLAGRIGDITIDTGDGADSVHLSNVDSNNITINADGPSSGLGGGGIRGLFNQTGSNDLVTLTNVNADASLTITTGGGADDVALNHVTVTGDGLVTTGAGNDELHSHDGSYQGSFNAVFMGAGNDLLESGGNDFRSAITLISGGLGSDAGLENPQDHYPLGNRIQPIILGFESYT